MSIWLNRAGRHGEFERRFLDEGRVYLTWTGLDRGLGGQLGPQTLNIHFWLSAGSRNRGMQPAAHLARERPQPLSAEKDAGCAGQTSRIAHRRAQRHSVTSSQRDAPGSTVEEVDLQERAESRPWRPAQPALRYFQGEWGCWRARCCGSLGASRLWGVVAG
jgi:hypothetical protein